MTTPSRRSVLAVAGGLAVAGTLAACGSGPAPAGASPTAPGPATPATPVPADPGPEQRRRVLVVGHRGASGYRPEHTAPAYELALRMGADAVDVDLVATRDGALVARHEPEIGGTTDVAARPEFASRRRTGVVIDGTSYDGWFASDFTLAELRTLRATERIPATRPHNTLYDGRYALLTLDDVLDVLDRVQTELGRPVGVLPEVKHSTWHRSVGLPIEPALVETLRRRGRDTGSTIVQSFETANLRELRGQLRCGLLQLADAADVVPADLAARPDPAERRTYADLLTAAGLRDVATYATWIGPTKDLVTPQLLADARAAGVRTMPYTFRNENEFLPAPQRLGGAGAPRDTYGDAFAEYAAFYGLGGSGVEGLFSDNPDTAIAALAG